MRNWNYIKKNDDKNSQNQELWFEIHREYKKNGFIFKAQTTGGFHLEWKEHQKKSWNYALDRKV